MRSDGNVLFAALAGFSGGLMFGLFMGSTQGQRLRRDVRDRVRLGTRQVEQRLKAVESHLQDLEHLVQDARRQFIDRVKSNDDDDSWDVSRGDVVRELPHLPRK